METTPNRKKNFFSEWLEKLQQESWQLELLISGLALFGIWQSRTILHKIDYYLDVHLIHSNEAAVNIFVSLLWASWSIFLINLLIHIVIRGFWIGAIGLRYVSGDIDYDDLDYSEKFTNYFKKRHGSFDDYIERLEKLSSVLFSFTFLLFFMLLSFVMYFLVFIIMMTLLEKIFPQSSPGNPALISLAFAFSYFGMGIIVLIDFVTLGAFKKITEKYISGIFYFVYRFYEIVSLSFIYRPLLLNFIDNRYTKRLFFLAIPYGLILLGVQGFSLEKFQYFPALDKQDSYHSIISSESINWRYYDDLRKEHFLTFNPNSQDVHKLMIHYVSLERFENYGDHLRFFLEYRESDNTYLDSQMVNIAAYRKLGLRHWFMKNSIQDSTLNLIGKRQAEDLRLLRKVLNGDIPEDADMAKVNDFKQYKREDAKDVRAKITAKYRKEKVEYNANKLSRIKENILALHDVSINGNSIDDQLTCNFFIHQNMHERGLLCYAPIDSLSTGEHKFGLKKKVKDLNCKFDCLAKDIELPFRIVKNN